MICEENGDNIEKRIQNMVTNIGVERNIEDMLHRLKPIAVALDRVTKNDCFIPDSVLIWKRNCLIFLFCPKILEIFSSLF